MRYFHAGENIEFVLTENQERTYEKHNHVSKYVAGLILNGCAEMGFYDQSHFDKAFHSILGISPKEYVVFLMR
ncbi:MAG: AraC family transcriptional regulator [bacterium]|nr:AraC family transcriptional regulator [bacterium]